MEKRKISEEEVVALYQFTRQHYVEYYDVQTELVDHLASSIEAQWQENPEVSFEEALQKEFKKFGVFGFSEVLGKRQRAMEKKYLKLIWNETKVILARPKTAILILILFPSFYFLLNLTYGTYVLLGAGFVYLLLALIYVGKKSSKLKKKIKNGEKVYLLETIIFNTGGLFSLTYLPFQLIYASDMSGNLYVQMLLAFLIIIVILAAYVCFYELPKKKAEILKQVYPELKY